MTKCWALSEELSALRATLNEPSAEAFSPKTMVVHMLFKYLRLCGLCGQLQWLNCAAAVEFSKFMPNANPAVTVIFCAVSRFGGGLSCGLSGWSVKALLECAVRSSKRSLRGRMYTRGNGYEDR